MTEEKKDTEFCMICGKDVLMQIYRGTRICSETCRKIAANEVTVERATVHAPEPIVNLNHSVIH